MFLNEALQNFQNLRDCVDYWVIQIHKFLESQNYSVEEYNQFLKEASTVWPTDKIVKAINPSRHIIRKVSFAPAYYGFCLRTPNYKIVDETTLSYYGKSVEGSFSPAVVEYYDQSKVEPGVIFLKNKEDILWYFHNFICVGGFIFYILTEYWRIFQTGISQDKIDLFAARRVEQDRSTIYSTSGNLLYCVHFSNAEPDNKTVNNDQYIKHDVPMCKILRECLEWSQNNLKTYIQKYYYED